MISVDMRTSLTGVRYYLHLSGLHVVRTVRLERERALRGIPTVIAGQVDASNIRTTVEQL